MMVAGIISLVFLFVGLAVLALLIVGLVKLFQRTTVGGVLALVGLAGVGMIGLFLLLFISWRGASAPMRVEEGMAYREGHMSVEMERRYERGPQYAATLAIPRDAPEGWRPPAHVDARGDETSRELEWIPSPDDPDEMSAVVAIDPGETSGGMIATVYPSMEEAAKAAGRALGYEMRSLVADQAVEDVQIVVAPAPDVEPNLAGQVVLGLRAVLADAPPGLSIRSTDADALKATEASDDPRLVAVWVEVEKKMGKPLPWAPRGRVWQSVVSGHVVANARSAGGTWQGWVNFVNKPWAGDGFAGFAGQYSDRKWLRFETPETQRQTSASEARRIAIEKAIPELRRRVQLHLHRQHGISETTEKDQQYIDQLVRSELESGGEVVTDEFSQSFRRPYGTVWHHAILVDPEKMGMMRMADRAHRHATGREVSSWVRVTSVLGLVVLVGVLYAFANAATKGYYTWNLRAVSLLIVAVAVVALLAMMN